MLDSSKQRSSNIAVRRATREDGSTLIRLLQALADYEHLPGPDEGARQRLLEHGWPTNGTAPLFTAWLAELGGEPAGCAFTSITYSTFLARPTLYLEDLFVLPDYRRLGTGSALFSFLTHEARRLGCGRMEWVVLDWNQIALEFYHSHSATYLPEWRCYRLTL